MRRQTNETALSVIAPGQDRTGQGKQHDNCVWDTVVSADAFRRIERTSLLSLNGNQQVSLIKSGNSHYHVV